MSINLYTKEIIPNLLTQVYPTLTITQHKDYKCFFLSHKIYDYKSMFNVWINESRTNLKLNEYFILTYKLNDNVVIHLCLNLNEFIYSWSWKIVVINFLRKIRSLLTVYRLTVLTSQYDHWVEFQIVRSPFSRCRIALVSIG